MIDTVASQSEALHALYIGISYPSESEQQLYEAHLDRVRSRLSGVCSSLTIKRTKTPCSQGKMWQRMVRDYASLSEPNTWILFSDDDDLWHKHRVKVYMLSLQKIDEMPPSQQLCVSNIRSNVYVTSDQDTRDVKAREIDGLLNSGVLRLGSQNMNYWDICMRGTIFCNFINIANDFLLQDPMFDVLLRHYVCSSLDEKCINIQPVSGNWMYFWRKQDGACSRLRNQYTTPDCEREVLRYAVERQMMSSLDHIDVTIETCMSKWIVGANPYKVRYDAWRFGSNFPVELQRRIGMFDREPAKASIDKAFAGLDAIDMLDQHLNLISKGEDPSVWFDTVLLDMCDHHEYAYREVRNGICAILEGQKAEYTWLPPRARAFMEAFKVA